MVYDEIVCLGCNCEVTWNVRDYFGIEKAFPFDWWITPNTTLISILQNKFNDLLNFKNLVFSSDGHTVLDAQYNVLYHHDFPRDADGNVIMENREESCRNAKEKYEYLSHRFLHDLAGKKVLFIRNNYINNGSPYLGYETVMPDHNYFKLLCDTLFEVVPNCNFDLLVTDYNPAPTDFEYHGANIAFDRITNYNDANDFKISPKGWRELFERQKIKLASCH